MKPLTASQIELCYARFPQFTQQMQELMQDMLKERDINSAEETAVAAFQKAGQTLLQEWAQPTATAKPCPGVEYHVKKK
jgi:ABC-type proline/glycine betaine transport system substrate-binding protein